MSDSSDLGFHASPSIALGCMSLPEAFSEAEKVVHRAIDSGLRYFDTADLYQKGKNEENLGRAIRGRRENLYVASKVGNQWNPDGKSWSWNPRKAYLLPAVEASLKRLRIDHLDLCQLHGGTLEDPWDEVFEAFGRLREQGKIRGFGISSIRPNVIRKVMGMNPPATIMMQYSPLDRRPEESVFPLLEQSGTRVLVRGAFAKGILIDKPVVGFLDFPAEKVAEIKAEIAASGFSPEAVLIRFGLIEKAVASLVIGASSVAQVQKLRAGLEESEAVPDDLILRLKEKLPKNQYQDHR
ncbi:aldo/keto reductase [Algoriphagus sp. H41]|uniref:Aldo/keto reductase n=1 Tax=Algoriphagus oliviformis TaxID=2811231 RepID=A0ABS3C708_9BACT|nr:aldo/keto reductase [Algoriphagus oliviformis]MBN7812625.1 aldo/keto reductase [Algoriphagus oliviformis]